MKMLLFSYETSMCAAFSQQCNCQAQLYHLVFQTKSMGFLFPTLLASVVCVNWINNVPINTFAPSYLYNTSLQKDCNILQWRLFRAKNRKTFPQTTWWGLLGKLMPNLLLKGNWGISSVSKASGDSIRYWSTISAPYTFSLSSSLVRKERVFP